MKINIEEIELKIKILEDKKTKAIITLDFGDFVVKGFRITESEFVNVSGDKRWFMPPSYKGGPKWHPIFFMPDKELWQKLEKKVWKEYKIKNDEHQKKMLGISDDEWQGL